VDVLPGALSSILGLGGKRFRLRSPSTQHSLVWWEPSGVRAAVVELDQGSAQMVGVGGVTAACTTPTGLPDVDVCAESCDEALTRAEDMTVRYCGRKLVPDWVTMSVPPQIARSYPIVVRRHRRDPEAGLTRQELHSLLRLGYRTAQDEIAAMTDEPAEDFVYGSLSEIRIDDQVTPDPTGLPGRDIQARLDFYLLPLEWIRALEVIADRLGLRVRSIVPQQAAYAAPIGDVAALLIAIYPHNTCMSATRRGRLEWSALSDFGSDDMITMAARALDLHGGQADALMAAYRAGRLQQEVELRLARAFWVELQRWMHSLVDAAGDNARGGRFPHRIYVVDTASRVPEAIMSLETPYWENLLPFERCPEVFALEPSMVGKVLDLTTRASGVEYLGTRALARLAAETYAGENGLDCALVECIRWRTPRV